MHKAVFLDRDGTINEETGYLSDPKKLVLIPGAADALARLKVAGFMLIVVTNQSGIARGMFTEADLHRVNDELASQLGSLGASVDAYYFCPHHPRHGAVLDCDCRKPKPGMPLRAAIEHGIDLSRSYFVGDKASDIELGVNSGGRTVLVLTGYGQTERGVLEDRGIIPDHIAAALPDAADWIIADSCASS